MAGDDDEFLKEVEEEERGVDNFGINDEEGYPTTRVDGGAAREELGSSLKKKYEMSPDSKFLGLIHLAVARLVIQIALLPLAIPPIVSPILNVCGVSMRSGPKEY